MKKQILVCIAGLGGAIGSTICVGLSTTTASSLSTKLGMVTESPEIKKLGLDFIEACEIEIDGWDIINRNIYEVAKNLNICPSELIEISKEKLKLIIPRIGFVENTLSIKHWILNEAEYIKEKCSKNNIKQVIIVNLCPTESHTIQTDDTDVNWEDLDSLNFTTKGVSLSRIYFRLAIEVGASFINYTPNTAETESLKKLANKNGIAYCGRDGKTGQTFLKTVIAPAFRDKNYHIDGWFSLNILGNNDGVTLSDPNCMLTKRISKSECLNSILGYQPGFNENSDACHQVHIHYYPPRGDAKEAWDNIDFQGFLGKTMQMKINWLGQDSILAAPSIIDLIRLMHLSTQNEHYGMIDEFAYFFKTPLFNPNKNVQHASCDQFNDLVNYLKKFQKKCSDSIYQKIIDIIEQYKRDDQYILNMHPYQLRISHAATLAETYDSQRNHFHIISNRRNTIDESMNAKYINDLCIEELKNLLETEHIWLYPNSNSDLDKPEQLIISSFCQPGDTVFVVPIEYGGNPELIDLIKNNKLNIKFIPYIENDFQIDIEKLHKELEEISPSLVYFDITDYIEYLSFDESNFNKFGNTAFVYNISSVLGTAINRVTDKPFCEYFDLVYGSLGRTVPGPNHFFWGSKNEYTLNRIIHQSTETFHSERNRDMLSLAISLIEFRKFGKSFVEQTFNNVNDLSEMLRKSGCNVISQHNVSNPAHQVWLKFSSLEEAQTVQMKLKEIGIISHLGKTPFLKEWGISLGLQEASFFGYEKTEIAEIADIIASVIFNTCLLSTAKRRLSILLKGKKPIWKTPDFVLSLLKYFQ